MLQCSRDVVCVRCTAFGADGNKSTAQCSHIQVAAPCLIVQVLHAALRNHDRVLEVVEHAWCKHDSKQHRPGTQTHPERSRSMVLPYLLELAH